MNIFSWMLKQAREHRPVLLTVCLFSVLCALLDIVPYYIIYLMVSALLAGLSVNLGQYALVILAAIVGKSLLHWLVGVLVHKAGYEIIYAVRASLAARLGVLPMSFFNEQSLGTVHKAMLEDSERVETLFCHNLPDLVMATVTPVLCLALMFYTNWQLALFAFLPFPLAIFSQFMMMKVCSKKIGSYHDAMEEMNNSVQEYVGGMVTIKALNRSVFSFSRFANSVRNFHDVVKDWSASSSTYYALFETVLVSGLLFVLIPGMVMYAHGGIAMADLVLFLMLSIGYAVPLSRLLEFSTKLREIAEGVRRIDRLLTSKSISIPENPQQPERFDIEFDHVNFSHEPGKPLFIDVSLKIPADSITAFVGPSGSGKTTAAMLLARFQDIDGGSIKIGGVDISEIAPESIFSQMSIVFQDTFIFNDTLIENIKCARPEATDQQALEAARLANADGFIRNFPQGYSTLAGEGGVALSGGERQRIAIARAILRDAPILILDEATAYADPENEHLIQESFSRLMVGKTVVIVAHHLQTITDADNIVVFNQGKICGAGRHAELLENCEMYRKMWSESLDTNNWSFGSKIQGGLHE